MASPTLTENTRASPTQTREREPDKLFNFTLHQRLTEDLEPFERIQVFNALPQALQDEGWTVHARWIADRSSQEMWIASDSPYGYKEWCECRQ